MLSHNGSQKGNGISGLDNKTNVSHEVYTEEKLKGMRLSVSLKENIRELKKIVGNNVDLVIRSFTLGRIMPISATLFYFDNLIDSRHTDTNILQPLISDVYTTGLISGPEIAREIIMGNVITRAQIKKSKNMKELLDGLLIGEVILLIDGIDDVQIISSKGYEYRSVTEADVEPVVKGPRDAFIEVLSVNLGLIRRRIRNPNLICEGICLGRATNTTVCIVYIKGICSQELVDEVRSRMSKIDIDGVLGSSYIEEFITDEPFSIFPLMRNTERPDVVSAALLEGRVAVIADNTPVALIAPGEFFSLLHASEDYYNSFIFTCAVRILRYISLIIALTLPAFYISVSNFHRELIPTKLLTSIVSARTGVPLPNFIEALLMEGTFEILREAGVRLPRPVGQAVSIVGALVIGQAAVQANIVSPLMVIVVALTGIATFTMPQYSFSHPIRILRFILMIIASILGLYGVMLGLLFILLHLCSIRSFGMPYLSPLAPFKVKGLKDTIIRAPWWALVTRPPGIAINKKRMASGEMPKPTEDGRNKK